MQPVMQCIKVKSNIQWFCLTLSSKGYILINNLFSSVNFERSTELLKIVSVSKLMEPQPEWPFNLS